MEVNALVKEKTFKIYCGEGNQKVRWLTDAAIIKYENLYKKKCGLAYGVKLESGHTCDLNSIVKESFRPNENIWILLREEYDALKEEV